jgi:F420-0:gamma-glutamyl ligase
MSISLSVVPVVGLPEVTEGDRLGELVAGAAQLEPKDVLVVSQKVVSKAEGRVRRLAEVEPGS